LIVALSPFGGEKVIAFKDLAIAQGLGGGKGNNRMIILLI
jgi:hypothetical protein